MAAVLAGLMVTTGCGCGSFVEAPPPELKKPLDSGFATTYDRPADPATPSAGASRKAEGKRPGGSARSSSSSWPDRRTPIAFTSNRPSAARWGGSGRSSDGLRPSRACPSRPRSKPARSRGRRPRSRRPDRRAPRRARRRGRPVRRRRPRGRRAPARPARPRAGARLSPGSSTPRSPRWGVRSSRMCWRPIGDPTGPRPAGSSSSITARMTRISTAPSHR